MKWVVAMVAVMEEVVMTEKGMFILTLSGIEILILIICFCIVDDQEVGAQGIFCFEIASNS